MSPKSLVALIVLGLALLIGSQTVYVVKETDVAIKLKFGEIVQTDIEPGVHFKVPFIEVVKRFDGRVITLDTKSSRFLTSGKKYAIVDAYAQWRISDVGAFYKATSGSRIEATTLLVALMNKGLRDEIAARTLHEVVSGERDNLMTHLTAKLNEQTQQELGIDIIDMRVKAIDLPEDLSRSVYGRMAAERSREAREHRSQGQELAEGIQADADRQQVVIQADAYGESERIRGDGDAKATSIYASAYQKDGEFYAFTRSLKAYTESFKANDILLLEPNNEFFRYMKASQPE